MEFFGKTNIDFLKYRKGFLIFSIVLISVGIILSAILGLDYGIDFEGGTELAVSFEKPINTDRIRDAVEQLGITGSEIKSFGSDTQYMIRIKQSSKTPKEVGEAIDQAIPEIKMTVLQMNQIGPKIGSELRGQAIIAMIIALVALLIYIAFRFEFVYGCGAILAIFHDIVVTFTVALIIHKLGIVNMEINLTFLAAMLTVIGYSINNTVVIFDRIRENREYHKDKSIVKLVNLSINETLSRTIITVLTTLLVLIMLIAFGGTVLKPFAVIMTLGTCFGVYSSIYISTSYVVWQLERRGENTAKK